MKQDANTRLQLAQTRLDSALDNARQVALAVTGLVGKPCDEVDLELDEQVALAPGVRSINLIQGDTLYCTSLYGSYRERLDLNSYTDGRLKLFKGNPVTPNTPFMALRIAARKGSVLVVLDGHFISNMLQTLSKDSPLTLVVGHQRWRFDQPPARQRFPLETPGYLEQPSSQYPFRFVTKLPDIPVPVALWHYARVTVLAFIALSILVGGLVFRWNSRKNTFLRDMEEGMSRQEFVPYIQPVVAGDNGRVIGGEVLMRWQHPELGMVPPDRFIPTAESSGLIVAMTRSLMRQASAALAPYQRALPERFHLGFNISACHFRDTGLLESCRQLLDAFSEYPILLILELTERELLEEDELTRRVFAELREMGIKIAIDDFGTGHSSLTYLQQFEIDYLKLDKSFVGLIGTNALSRHIVDSVIDLASRLELKTVAEGVETDEQADYLAQRNVDFQQGYLHGCPVPMAEFVKQWEVKATAA